MPHPGPKQGTALISPWLKPGVLRAGFITDFDGKERCEYDERPLGEVRGLRKAY